MQTGRPRESSDYLDLSGRASSSSTAKAAMEIVDALFRGLGDLLISGRDEMYTNEYILMNFESAEPTNMFDSADYTFDKREVEFILYGKFDSAENYEMTLLQLFAIRFAFRLIDAFMQDEVRLAGHPILVFVAAVKHGLIYAYQDVETLAEEGSCPSDLQRENAPKCITDESRGDKRLTRILTDIQHKTDIDLTTRKTYAYRMATTSLSLSFIPQIDMSLKKKQIFLTK